MKHDATVCDSFCGREIPLDTEYGFVDTFLVCVGSILDEDATLDRLVPPETGMLDAGCWSGDIRAKIINVGQYGSKPL